MAEKFNRKNNFYLILIISFFLLIVIIIYNQKGLKNDNSNIPQFNKLQSTQKVTPTPTEKRIRVRIKETGETGTIPIYEFDSEKHLVIEDYSKLDIETVRALCTRMLAGTFEDMSSRSYKDLNAFYRTCLTMYGKAPEDLYKD